MSAVCRWKRLKAKFKVRRKIDFPVLICFKQTVTPKLNLFIIFLFLEINQNIFYKKVAAAVLFRMNVNFGSGKRQIFRLKTEVQPNLRTV